MKKEYINPEMEIVEIEVTHSILAGSELGKNPGEPIGGGDALSPDFDFNFDPDILNSPEWGL